ncbi:NADP-dependent 3-hydroxy acid dehydrogenase YdfG [Cnuella takakiae]|uniref:NADP-dependent 3-hydroxy acid dehydrogenase YdfG n=1 Tax=Cnuella takakiae TaxID=1302690 RepID=A0A1M5C2E6_9BACT|nr:SDR family NAD(P)-dependent oxidoreductase [Cnuella takakiae]OLY93601.1 NAD(P)-dependent oxidoreductase [Cnuella takakiae]SHF48964.1 NADP-dependent 3-hydroxy acid dehydrogenase YdfG [Cnuella takakiae]
MKKTVFITGATAGFGEACARKFAANNYRLILNGRRVERLEQLQKELQDQYGTESLLLPFDVRDRATATEAIENLPEAWQQIDFLINNAGLALGRDLFDEASLDDWDTMIDTNVKGLLYVSKAVVPYMVKQGGGHIINLGSIAGKEVYERGNAYCASKYAVDALSRGMRIDLLRHKIKVTAIHPGAAETEFSLVRFKGDAEAAGKVYDGYEPLVGEDIAEIIYYTATLPAHVCINDLVVTCTAQANASHFFKG